MTQRPVGMWVNEPDLLERIPRSFASPGGRTGRIGVVDAGSNSVRLVIFDANSRSPVVLCNEKVMCRLGAELERTGKLDPAGRDLALRALRRFAALAAELRVTALAGIATAAIREASDGPEFCDEVAKVTGIRLRVASGEDEARLAAQGVLFGNPAASGVVVDLGGASMELCRIGGGRAGRGVSTPLGPLRLRHLAEDPNRLDAMLKDSIAQLRSDFGLDGEPLYLVGGAWRALARAHMERTGYPMRVIHEYTLTPNQARRHATWLAKASTASIAALPDIPEARLATLPLAGRILRHLIRELTPSALIFSSFGLREGVCLENLPPVLRGRDPLISACEDEERASARAPGFGAELGEWLCRFLGPADAHEERLMRALGHLSDVCWRTHPDYRIISCWEAVTRATITDTGHAGRALMGVALAMRYRRGKKVMSSSTSSALLDDEARRRAAEIGLTMRLGCTLAAATPGALPLCQLNRADEVVVLTLPASKADLLGPEVEKRLNQLAEEMGCESRIEVLGVGPVAGAGRGAGL